MFDIETTAIAATLTHHSRQITQVVFAPTGDRLFSAGEDGLLVLYDPNQVYSATRIINFVTPGPVAVCLSSDGGKLSYAGPTRATVTTIDAITLEEISAFQLPRAGAGAFETTYGSTRPTAASLTYSADGAELYVLTACGRMLRVRNSDRQVLREAVGIARGGKGCMAVCPSGPFLATGGDDGSVKVWDALLRPPRRAQRFVGHQGQINRAAFEDDKRLLTVGDLICVWAFRGGESEHKRKTKTGLVPSDRAAAPSQEKVASMSLDTMDAELPNADNGVVGAGTAAVAEFIDSKVSAVPDVAHPCYVNSDKHEVPLSYATAAVGVDTETPVSVSAVSPDDLRVDVEFAPANGNGGISEFIATRKQQGLEIAAAASAPVETAFVPPAPKVKAHFVRQPCVAPLSSIRYETAPDQAGLELATVYGCNPEGRRNVQWHPKTGLFLYSSGPILVLQDLGSRAQRHLCQHAEEISSIAVTDDGDMVATACGPSESTDMLSQICLWDPAPSAEAVPLRSLLYHVAEVGCLSFSHDGSMLLSVGNYRDSSIALWSTSSGALVAASQSDVPIHAAAWDPNAFTEFSTVGSHGALCFWMLDLQHREPVLAVHVAELPEDLRGCHMTSLCYGGAGSSTLYVGDSNGKLSAWDTKHNGCLATWTIERAVEISSVVVRGNRVITGSACRALRLWTLDGGAGCTLVAEMPMDGVVTSSCFDAAGEMGAVATTAATAWYINWHERASIRLVSGHRKQVRCLVSSHDDRVFVTGGDDGTVRIWSIETSEQLIQFELAEEALVSCMAIALNSDSTRCTAGYADGTLRIFDLERMDLEAKSKPHTSAVTAVGYDRDDRVIISGSQAGLVVVSSATAGSTLRLVSEHSGSPITCIDICKQSGGGWLAGAHDRRISLWRSDWSADVLELTDWLTFPAPDFVEGAAAAVEPPTLARYNPTNQVFFPFHLLSHVRVRMLGALT